MSRQATLADFFTKPKASPTSSPKAEEGFLAQLKKQINNSPGTPTKFKARTPGTLKDKMSVAKTQAKEKEDRGSKRRVKSERDANLRPTKKAKTENSPKLVQSVLDLGQRDWQKKCEECGMLYSPGNEEDEATHQKYHKKAISPLPFNVCRLTREEWSDGTYITSLLSNVTQYKQTEKVKEIQDMVDKKLNFAKPDGQTPEDEENFLFIKNKKLVGCAIVERISTAYPIYDPHEKKGKEKDDEESAEQTTATDMMITHIKKDSPQAVSIGVSRIWVHPSHRRQGIATKLLDVVRKNYVYGHIVEKRDLAFSQPSLDGKLLGTAYTGSKNFLVFTDAS